MTTQHDALKQAREGMHTPLPWRITAPDEKKGPREIVGANGSTVAKLTTLDLPNAELIVAAVNTALSQQAEREHSATERLAQFRQWVDATGAIGKSSSWYGELEAIVVGRGEPAEQEKAAFVDKIKRIADDYIPDNDRDAPLALQEMRDALHSALSAESSQQAPSTAAQERDVALRLAEKALASCYNVCEWPADGTTPQDIALTAVRAALAHKGAQGEKA